MNPGLPKPAFPTPNFLALRRKARASRGTISREDRVVLAPELAKLEPPCPRAQRALAARVAYGDAGGR